MNTVTRTALGHVAWLLQYSLLSMQTHVHVCICLEISTLHGQVGHNTKAVIACSFKSTKCVVHICTYVCACSAENLFSLLYMFLCTIYACLY